MQAGFFVVGCKLLLWHLGVEVVVNFVKLIALIEPAIKTLCV